MTGSKLIIGSVFDPSHPSFIEMSTREITSPLQGLEHEHLGHRKKLIIWEEELEYFVTLEDPELDSLLSERESAVIEYNTPKARSEEEADAVRNRFYEADAKIREVYHQR